MVGKVKVIQSLLWFIQNINKQMLKFKKKLDEIETTVDGHILNLDKLTEELKEEAVKDMNGSVLLVDDEAIITEDYAVELNKTGLYTECVQTGEDALDRLRARPFSVMVTDLRLDGISGKELIAKAHIIRPEMRIIIATAFPQDYYRESEQKRRKDDFEVEAILSKPFVTKHLACRVRNPNSIEEKDE